MFSELIGRCKEAIKLIRAKDNRVPIMKFLYNRTSLVSNDLIANVVNKSPLHAHSTLNPSFKLNAAPNVNQKNAGLKVLPKRIKDVAQSLGINGPFLFNKIRTKELNAQITDQIRSTLENDSNEILIQTNTVPMPTIETANMHTQTAELKCERCTERNKCKMVNAQSQTYIRNISIGVQTNEKDYREPIVELLSRLTAAQLVSIKDFATIIDEPRPRDHDEMFKMRERLMDIYSLSQRDADTVRAAEDNRMDDCSFIDDLPFRGREGYGAGPSSDLSRRSNSPRFNGNNVGMDRGSFAGTVEPSDFNDRNKMNNRNNPRNERFQRMDGARHSTPEDEEFQRKRYIEMERKRLEDLEMNQRRFLEEEERRRMDQEHQRKVTLQGDFQRQNQQISFDGDMQDMDMKHSNMFNSNRGGGAMNRRGRGAFRDSFRGGRGSRR